MGLPADLLDQAKALCKSCAPILQRELAAAQAEIAVEQAREKLRQRDLAPLVALRQAFSRRVIHRGFPAWSQTVWDLIARGV